MLKKDYNLKVYEFAQDPFRDLYLVCKSYIEGGRAYKILSMMDI